MNLFIPMLLLGLGASTHCVFMCGSMVMTYAIKGEGEGSPFRRALPHIAYHTAKLASYMTVGLVLGAVGSALNLSGVSGYVTVGAGLFMILLGLQMTGRFPVLRKLSPRPPKFLMNALMKTRKKANADAAEGRSSLGTPIAFGALTGLMPCGPLQAAQLQAATAGSALAGAAGMFAFGLGTAPLMLAFGVLSGYLGMRYKKYLAVVAAVVIMGFGLVMLNRGAMLLGSPVTANTFKQAILPAPAADPANVRTGADGVAEVDLVIENTRYVPQALAIPAGKPVRIVVDRREASLCSDQLWIPDLGIAQKLTPNGKTVIELPATKAGSYSMTCQMGMMSGQLSVGGAAAGRAGGSTGLLLVLGAGALAALGYYATRQGKAAAQAPAPARKGHGKSGGKPAGKAGTSAAGGGGRHVSTPVPAVFGLAPQEVVVVVASVLVAVVAGLVLGGLNG